MFAYCGNNPVSRFDPTGEAWWHWAIAAEVVLIAAVVVVATAGGAAPAVMAVGAAAMGFAAPIGGTAATISAGVFIGSSVTLGVLALDAASKSNSIQEFCDKGNWGTVAMTVGGGAIYAVSV